VWLDELATNQSYWENRSGRTMKCGEVERASNELLIFWTNYDPGICLKRQRKIMKILYQED
jgi:hypothetical protein